MRTLLHFVLLDVFLGGFIYITPIMPPLNQLLLLIPVLLLQFLLLNQLESQFVFRQFLEYLVVQLLQAKQVSLHTILRTLLLDDLANFAGLDFADEAPLLLKIIQILPLKSWQLLFSGSGLLLADDGPDVH